MRLGAAGICGACCPVNDGAVSKSRPAMRNAARFFSILCMVVAPQKRKRAVMVTRRMLPVPVTSPKAREFTTVLMEVKWALLKTLLADRRRSKARDSRMVMVLFMAMSRVTCPGPSMMLRPASPKAEPAGFAQVGPRSEERRVGKAWRGGRVSESWKKYGHGNR